jgi:acyl-CoA thioesterase
MSQIDKDELARACADSMYARDQAAQTMGIQIVKVHQGNASLSMKVSKDMLNGHDICHGGYIFALADTAFAYACNSYNKVTVAQNCDIDFLQVGKFGDELLAIAQERTRGGRTGLYDVSVSRADGEIVAQFRGRSFQIKGEVIQQ